MIRSSSRASSITSAAASKCSTRCRGTNPFWEKTNKKARVFKAAIWFGQALEADPADIEARWILAAISLAHCEASAIPLLAPLVADYPSNVRWLVEITEWILLQSGADYTAALREQLSLLQNVPAVRSLLKAPAGNDELGRSVRVALSVLAGNSIHMAFDGLTGQ